MDYPLTKRQDEGAIDAFKESGIDLKKWSVGRIFLNSKKKSEQELAPIVRKHLKEIKLNPPDTVFVSDDFAFKKFFRPINKMGIPITFSGINGDPGKYGYQEGMNGVSGTLEKYNFPAMLKLVRSLRPEIKNVLVVSEGDITGKALLADFMAQSKEKSISSMKLNIKKYTGRNYEDLKKSLSSVDPSNTVVLIMVIYSQKNKKGEHVDYKVIEKWINKNTNFIDIGLAFFQVDAGRLLSLASSFYESGHYSANLLFNSIKEGKDLGKYPLRKHLPLRLKLNHARAKKLGIEFPYEILVYAETSEKFVTKKAE